MQHTSFHNRACQQTLIFRGIRRKISLAVWKQHVQRYLKRACLRIPLPSWFGKWKSRLSPPTQGNGGPQPSVRCTHKDNENVQTGTHSFRISPLWRTLLLPYKLRAKNTAAILHISGRCVPYSRVRCVQLALWYSLFEMCGLFLIALSYLIRYASVASAPISLGSKRCSWRCVFCFRNFWTFKMIKLIIAKIKKVVSFLVYNSNCLSVQCLNSCVFVPDIPWSRFGEGDYGIGGVLHPSQRRMPMVGRTT